jgi:hypothetical protein
MFDSEKSSGKDGAITTTVQDASIIEQRSPNGSLLSVRHADDALLAELGYKSEFKREFSVSCLP